MDEFKLERRSTEEIVDKLIVDVSVLTVKQGLIEKALKTLQKWMDSKDSITESDTAIFDSLNERILALEVIVGGKQL